MINLFPAVSPVSVLSGFIVGLLVGLTGVGGGSLMTPLLILVLGRHATTAVGTDLLYAAVTKGAGALAHSRKQNVDWRVVRRLAVGGMPAAALTIAVMFIIGIRAHTSPRLITMTLGIALLVSAGAILGRHRIRRWSRHAATVSRGAGPLTVLCGAILGVLVTMSSVGAGALGMVMLVALYPTRPLPQLVGSDIAHAVPLTLVAGLGHLLLLGTVDWVLLASLLIGSVPGVTIGSHLSRRLPERVLRPILATILTVVGFRMLTR